MATNDGLQAVSSRLGGSVLGRRASTGSPLSQHGSSHPSRAASKLTPEAGGDAARCTVACTFPRLGEGLQATLPAAHGIAGTALHVLAQIGRHRPYGKSDHS